MADNWYTGNASNDETEYRGWILGNFITPAESIRATQDVEVKWGIHPEGQHRDGWYTDEARTTMLLLISGRFRLDLSVGNVVLERQGDYVVWGPGIDHSWHAEADSVVVTIRWPSTIN